MRVVVDTNVLVFAMLKPTGSPAKILRLVLQGDLEIAINESILAEYQEVLARPRFDLAQNEVSRILDVLRARGICAPPSRKRWRSPIATTRRSSRPRSHPEPMPS